MFQSDWIEVRFFLRYPEILLDNNWLFAQAKAPGDLVSRFGERYCCEAVQGLGLSCISLCGAIGEKILWSKIAVE